MTALERDELLERIKKAVDAEPLARESATKVAPPREYAPPEILEPLM